MQLSLVAAVSLLASAQAAPHLGDKSDVKMTRASLMAPTDLTWDVTGWSAGCTRVCYYDFNITSKAVDLAPAFSAYCTGYADGDPYTECKFLDDGEPSRRLVSRMQAVDRTGPREAKIFVSYKFADPSTGASFNYTGSAVSTFNQFVAPVAEFNIEASLRQTGDN